MTNKAEKPDVNSFTFLLKCPGIQDAPTVVTAVVEETLIELLLDAEDPEDWLKEFWYWDNLQTRLFDEDGEIALSASGSELWDFMRDPHHGRNQYADAVQQHLANFKDCNEPYIHSLRDNYDIRHLTVIRAFKNQWLLLAEGTKK